VDPKDRIGHRILRRESQQLGGEDRAIVVVERPVEHEDTPVQELLPQLSGEERGLVVVSHVTIVRTPTVPQQALLLQADQLTAEFTARR
jgi:hypothetical protein